MGTHIRKALLALLLALPATTAAAQVVRPLSLVPERFPRWDVSGTWGPHYHKPRGALDVGNDWDAHHEFRLDLGRYWSAHLKGEVGASLQSWDGGRVEIFPVGSVPVGGYSFTREEYVRTTIAPSFTYQFLENAYAHPYLSTGLQLEITRTHAYRPNTTGRAGGAADTVPRVDDRDISLSGAPFVAAGFKSYFNSRAFVRTEGVASVGKTGVEQLGVRIGLGVDF